MMPDLFSRMIFELIQNLTGQSNPYSYSEELRRQKVIAERLQSDPAMLYSIPGIGGMFRNFANAQDYAQMQKDFEKNVGREIKYKSIRGYDSMAASSISSGFGGMTNVPSKLSRWF